MRTSAAMSLLHLLLCSVVLLPCDSKFQKQRESPRSEVPFCHIRSGSNNVTFVTAQTTDGPESSGQQVLKSTLPSSQGETTSINQMGITAAVKEFEYHEIKKATDNFSNPIDATGGNGEVCRGRLDDGTEVAVKCPIEYNGFNNPIHHIKNEIKIHSQVKHPRIVRLVGYCSEPHLCIVYEFMPRGNLFNHLHSHDHPHHVTHGATFLSWRQRITIANQVSEALVHLHNHKIFHVDVKSRNILFDDHLNAKLSDLGHSQIIELGKIYISMPAEGTPHLIDPYWRKTKQLTDKTDVYSFGILLVEMLTSQKTADLKRDKGGAFLLEKGQLMKSIDPSLKVGGNQVVLEQMMALASLAVNSMSDHIKSRPTMKEVDEEIKRIMRLDSCPSSFPFAPNK